MTKVQYSNARHLRVTGFTLIEMMITVVILGIIAAIAVPVYKGNVQKSRRSEAIQAIATYQTILERCYAQNFTYNGACPALPASGSQSAHGYYTITYATTVAGYDIYANTAGVQSSDTTCTQFHVDQTNARTQTPSGNSQCWLP